MADQLTDDHIMELTEGVTSNLFGNYKLGEILTLLHLFVRIVEYCNDLSWR